jgi:hypothetical protein
MDHRRKLWNNIREDLGPPEGCFLPWWMLLVYTLLFPLSALKWFLFRPSGFDYLHLTWKIHGIEVSDSFFSSLAVADGELYRFTTVNGVVTIERMPPTTNWEDNNG